MTFHREDRIRILLAVHKSLIGQISDGLDSVVLKWRNRAVDLRFYFRRPPTPYDAELVSEAETLMISHLPDIEINTAALISDASSVGSNEEYIFLRAPPETL